MYTSTTANMESTQNKQPLFTSDMFEKYYQKYKNENKLIIKTFNDFTIVKYNKALLDIEKDSMLGFFRSIILKKNTIVSFSPQKCLNFNTFIENNEFSDCNVSPMIEGTMINLFYDHSHSLETHEDLKHWVICTRSNIGASCRFNLDHKETFRDMFIEAARNIILYDTDLDKDLCYSFVLQHPKNKTIVPCEKPKITLTHVYKIKDNNVFEVTDSIQNDKCSRVSMIKNKYFTKNAMYTMNDWFSLIDICSGDELHHEIPGFMIKNKKGERAKINNIAYKMAKELHGNIQKKQYQYLKLRQENKLNDYLKTFPNDKEIFNRYQTDLYDWTEDLYNHYVDCFIVREKRLKNAPFEFKPILYNLHSQYINYLKPNNKKVNFNFVKEYVKHIPIPKLMFSLNYKHRPNTTEGKH